MKKFIVFVLVVVIIGVGGAICFIYSGIYNVSALVPHTALVFWAADTMSDHSIRAHGDDITAPADLSSPKTLAEGIRRYNKMCVTCHGAPGVRPAELAKGLYPHAPHLVDTSDDFTPGEIFWTIKNGIKMTGMPAFAPTHTDDQIWSLVAVVEKIGSWKAQDYAAELKAAGVTSGAPASAPTAAGQAHPTSAAATGTTSTEQGQPANAPAAGTTAPGKATPGAAPAPAKP